jgi:hypothetical protein
MATDTGQWQESSAVASACRSTTWNYLMLDLEFDTAGEAETFAGFLVQHVWSSAASSPGLGGAPKTRILDLVHGGER